jgi:DNA polymerase epsilon subunit 1
MLDEDRRLIAALDLYFIQMDGTRFKASVVYQPYLLVLPRDGKSLEVANYLGKKFSGQITKCEHIQKEDLDLPNHLSGLQQSLIKLSFSNNNNMMKVKRVIFAAVKKNLEREKNNTFYMKMLSTSLAQAHETYESSKFKLNFSWSATLSAISVFRHKRWRRSSYCGSHGQHSRHP